MKHNYNSGLSEFLRNASYEERKAVFLEAARQATEDQRAMIEKHTKEVLKDLAPTLKKLAEYDRHKKDEEV